MAQRLRRSIRLWHLVALWLGGMLALALIGWPDMAILWVLLYWPVLCGWAERHEPDFW